VLLDDEKDRKKNAEKLRAAVESLLYDADKRRAMSEAARNLGKPDAAANVARLITEIAAASR
jgi:UDP-N-acetylglucosamine:LPS N-acetylglucosamine transferase